MIYSYAERCTNGILSAVTLTNGIDTLALESLVAGADGWVAGLVVAYPEETVAIYKLVKAGKVKAPPDDERAPDMLENMISSEGFTQDDIPRVGRLLKTIEIDG